ncbi:hypothetical protein HYR69_07685 [Candidatus Sumerlaeota bacterium]|nr:hypothetical protein [Candidatus Sumerlaeota bacterium]MBI3735829.1 hypothetical protein [Candidatus Sumerlaeota bacterium]
MNDKLKLGIVLAALVLIAGWSIAKSMRSVPGAVGNNGYTSEMGPAPSPELRKSFEEMGKKARESGMTRPKDFDPSKMREQVEAQLPPAQREEFRKFNEQMQKRMERTREALSPDEQRQLMTKFMEAMRKNGGWGGGRGGGGRGGDGPKAE